MREITKKKNSFNIVLNSLKPHASDPTLLSCKFIILDFDVSLNNQKIEKETALGNLAKTTKNKPIRGYYIEDKSDFGGHEAILKDDGKFSNERNTVPMGVFTSEAYVENMEVDGVLKEVLVADAVLWKSQFIKPISLLEEWFNEGLTISMSCEYLYINSEFIDGVEVLKEPIYFEAHCLLGKEITPAYESARMISYNQLNEFKLLVAQAINQNKEEEVSILPEENLDLNKEIKDEEFKTQLNEISHDDIRQQIRDQVKAHILGEIWVWVADVYETYTVVEVEFNDGEDYTWKFYKFNYSIENEVVTVDLATQEEVKIKREWVAVLNELQEEVSALKSDKEELASKFNEATETILTLNTTIEELKPFQELALNAKREEKLVELNEKFSKAFNNAGAKEKFESEDVQTLLNEAVESSDALSQLNSMIVELVMNTQVKPSSEIAILGLNSERKNLIEVEEDEFEKRFKL